MVEIERVDVPRRRWLECGRWDPWTAPGSIEHSSLADKLVQRLELRGDLRVSILALRVDLVLHELQSITKSTVFLVKLLRLRLDSVKFLRSSR